MKTQAERMVLATDYPFAIAIAHWLYARLKKLKQQYPFLNLMPMHVSGEEASTQIKIFNIDAPTDTVNYVDIIEFHTKDESRFTVRMYEYAQETKTYKDAAPIEGNYDSDMTETVNLIWDHLFPPHYLDKRKVA